MEKVLSRKQMLEQKVYELEETLAGLKTQLHREIEAEQHEAIDELEVYLEKVNNKFTNLQDFWQILRNEVTELLQGKREKH
ncbi:MAG: hypothetical protein MRJ96_11230 [Nitrospirales bacterium]|nr:hypothetical protein [Nitrospira sp.]MDR4502013.1 hypothetical protein [Nitrospirales bacterium]